MWFIQNERRLNYNPVVVNPLVSFNNRKTCNIISKNFFSLDICFFHVGFNHNRQTMSESSKLDINSVLQLTRLLGLLMHPISQVVEWPNLDHYLVTNIFLIQRCYQYLRCFKHCIKKTEPLRNLTEILREVFGIQDLL